VNVSLRHWLQLSLTEGIGPILVQRIVAAAGGAKEACAVDAGFLRQVEGIGPDKSRLIGRTLKEASTLVDQELERCASAGVSLVCPDDVLYPVLLRNIPDPPTVLFMRGNLEPRDLNAMAIVGSRRCSLYGREQAERFGSLLAGAAFTVVSGGARGIDSAAHRGAIAQMWLGYHLPSGKRELVRADRRARRGAERVHARHAAGEGKLSATQSHRQRLIARRAGH
jgi:DNA processing protein